MGAVGAAEGFTSRALVDGAPIGLFFRQGAATRRHTSRQAVPSPLTIAMAARKVWARSGPAWAMACGGREGEGVL